MLSNSIRTVLKGLSSIPDWKTKRRIVVIESDDWGSLRMPSMTAFRRLEDLGINLRFSDAEGFNLNDNLATSKDLESLFEVLSGVKDSRGQHAVITPVSIVANPDFPKIKESGFTEYSYEPFTDTLKRSPGCENAFQLWKEGIEKKLFVPQMHGREHVNVLAWMKALQAGEKQTLAAFNEGVWGFKPSSDHDLSFMAAYSVAEPSDLVYHKHVIEEGLQLFEDLFGYKAVFFVPPNGVFHNSLNKVLASRGIQFRSGSRIQSEPVSLGKTRNRLHYHGQKDRHGIRYIIRNCVFEPYRENTDWVDTCMNQIHKAFSKRLPAIISTHRVSYVGALRPQNRDQGLKQLTALLKAIVKHWPEVEFMTTEELGALMR